MYDEKCNDALIKFSSLTCKKPPYLSICYDKQHHHPCHHKVKCITGPTGATGSVPLTSPFHTNNIIFDENTAPTIINIPGGYIYSVSWSMTLRPNANATFIQGDLNLNNSSISSMQFLTNSSSKNPVDLQNTTLLQVDNNSTLILQYYAHKQNNDPTDVEIICATVNIFSICKL